MANDEVSVDPVAELAEEFAARYRHGERPPLSEYTCKYPELAERIREVFPLVVLMEEAGDEASASKTAEARRLASGLGAEKLEVIGGYRLLREVGRGGMGVVYEAEQLSLGRHVALKVLPLRAAQAGGLERFHREACAAARLHHTNIVPVYEVGDDQHVCYYAMQFIHGQPLDEVVAELRRTRDSNADQTPEGLSGRPARPIALSLLSGSLAQHATPEFTLRQGNEQAAPDTDKSACAPTVIVSAKTSSTSADSQPRHYYDSVARIGLQVAEALEYAHGQGVIHRDIKPSNLLLDTGGRVWVADFGLAKTDGDALTQSGDIVGTIPYMAPERFRGWADPRSDIYSLGLTLYEMLALRPAFAGSDRCQLMLQATQANPPRLRKIDPLIPRDLGTIIAKATDKEPERRYQTAGELAADLQRFLDDRPILARRISPVERAWRWCKRNPAVASLTASVAVLAVVLLVGSWVGALLRDQRDRALEAQERAEKADKEKGALLRRAVEAEREVNIRSILAQAQAKGRMQLPGRRSEAFKLLAKATRLEPSPELRAEMRDLAIRLSGLTDIRLGSEEWEGWLKDTTFVVFDSKLKRYARGDHKGAVSVRSVPDDREIVALPASGREVIYLRFSPDGEYLAVIAGVQPSVAQVWDLARRKTMFEQPRPVYYTALDFTIDSRQVVIGQENGSIGLYELATDTLVRDLCKVPWPIWLSVSPNGVQLAITSRGSPGVEICDLASGSVRKTLTHPDAHLSQPTWHPHDPDLLATCGWGIFLWDVRTGKERARLPGQAGPTTNVAFSHRGDILASKGHQDISVRLWDPWTGRQLAQIPGPPSHGYIPLQFSPDDRRLAFALDGNKLGLWEIDMAREFRSLEGHAKLGEGPYTWFDIHRGGRLLAVGSSSGSPDGIHFWDLDTGRKLDFLPTGPTHTVRFHPSGEAFFSSHHEGDVHVWLIGGAGEPAGTWHLGPPRALGLAGRPGYLSLSGNARVMTVQQHGNQGIVVDLPKRANLLAGALPEWFPWRDLLGPRINPLSRRKISDGEPSHVSPNGRWVVGGTVNGVLVWDAQTGKRVRLLPAPGRYSFSEFSPDGRWLLISVAGEYCLYETGSGEPDSWRLRWRLPRNVGGDIAGPFAFSRDGQVLAIVTSAFTVRLIDPATGRDLANLEPPDPDRALPQQLRFSPDGSRLIVCTSELRAIHVWDLRLIGARLAELGLDWDLPAFKPPRAIPEAKPLRVEVNLGPFAGREHRQKSREHLRARAWQKAVDEANLAIELFKQDAEAWCFRAQANMALKQYDQAVADYQQALTFGPRDAMTENNLAWYVVSFPDARGDLVSRALAWARGAVDLDLKNGSYWNTLGVAHYRAGNWDDAIKALSKSHEIDRDREFAHNAFFLAMAHWQRGEKEEARRWQADAVRWMEKHAPSNAELRRFRAEAEQLVRPE
jgi:serine/threonine protein kinase/WD40 repeat protein/Tfp pilus assembly protein PilF